ncbi:MAG: glycosyl hydrolase family 18 protein [Bacillota bacterium]
MKKITGVLATIIIMGFIIPFLLPVKEGPAKQGKLISSRFLALMQPRRAAALEEAPSWISHKYYAAGDMVTYQGKIYKCIAAHKSTYRRRPTVAAHLWRPLAATPSPAATPTVFTTPGAASSPAFSPEHTPASTPAHSAIPTLTPSINPSPSAGSQVTATITVLPAAAPTPTAPGWPGRYKIVGYLGGWKDWTGVSIAGSQMTHINYAFANVRDARLILEQATDPANFNRLRVLKSQYPHLKTLLSVGGWSAGTAGFQYAASTAVNRAVFAESCAAAVAAHGFDGLDLDWEYPYAADRLNFTLMLKALRETLDARGAADGRRYLLTIAAGAGLAYANNTELGLIHNYLDWINLMAYDFGADRHNANLYESSYRNSTGLSCDAAVKILTDRGVPAGKVVLGVPFHGRAGTAWPTYATLVNNYINKNGYARYWDDTAKAAYLLNGQAFITYDDAVSLGCKTDYIKAHGLGGVMFWEYSQDYMGSLLYKLYSALR